MRPFRSLARWRRWTQRSKSSDHDEDPSAAPLLFQVDIPMGHQSFLLSKSVFPSDFFGLDSYFRSLETSSDIRRHGAGRQAWRQSAVVVKARLEIVNGQFQTPAAFPPFGLHASTTLPMCPSAFQHWAVVSVARTQVNMAASSLSLPLSSFPSVLHSSPPQTERRFPTLSMLCRFISNWISHESRPLSRQNSIHIRRIPTTLHALILMQTDQKLFEAPFLEQDGQLRLGDFPQP